MRKPIYLSVPPTTSATHRAAVAAEDIGVITTPRVGNPNYGEWPLWAADNGCFSQGEKFSLPGYLGWLDRVSEHAATCLFATAPDVLCDAVATWKRSAGVLGVIRSLGYKAALVAQNGLEEFPVDWAEFDCLFVGGDDAWKDGRAAASLVAEANQRGLWTHCGRVNGKRRLLECAARGYDSVDGTFLAFGPDKNIPRVAGWYRALERQQEEARHGQMELPW